MSQPTPTTQPAPEQPAAELHKVRTGPTSYLKLNDADLAAWKEAGNVEYSGPEDATPAEAAAQLQAAQQRKAPAAAKPATPPTAR